MEVWRPEVLEGRRPKVLSGGRLLVALALHLSAFLGFYLFALVKGYLDPKEKVVPIDLTVVVNENLDGVENEPPPLKNPEPPPPPPPKPRPRPKPAVRKPDPPKALEQIVTNVVKAVAKKDEPKKPEPKKPEPKKEQPKKEPPKKEQPQKTAKELREERIRRMRESVVRNKKPVTIVVDDAKRSGNGRTERQTMTEAQIRSLLAQGYRPGTSTQLAASERQRCLSLVQMALNEKWEALSPKVGRDGTVLLSVNFSSSGGMINVRLAQSCGDALSDQAALAVARRVTAIPGLSDAFISEFRREALTIRYQVRGR